MQSYTTSLLGGAIIGVAVSLMLCLNGRVTGVSGIVRGTLARERGDWAWRVAFVLGLVLGGLTLQFTNPELLTNTLERTLPVVLVAGFLVGFGTVMGSGCTSGHGICGISRWSLRSVVATIVFMAFGILAATVFK